jgi:uncharacterized damage-inducible protein DinB
MVGAPRDTDPSAVASRCWWWFLELIQHLVDSEVYWYSQLDNTFTNPFQDSVQMTLLELKSTHRKMANARLEFLNLTDPQHIIDVAFNQDDQFRVTVEGVPIQSVTHTNFHRGQLVEKYRKLGLEPPMIFHIGFFKK